MSGSRWLATGFAASGVLNVVLMGLLAWHYGVGPLMKYHHNSEVADAARRSLEESEGRVANLERSLTDAQAQIAEMHAEPQKPFGRAEAKADPQPRTAGIGEEFRSGDFEYVIESIESLTDTKYFTTSGGHLLIVKYTMENQSSAPQQVRKYDGPGAHVLVQWEGLTFEASRDATREAQIMMRMSTEYSMLLQPRLPQSALVAFELPPEAFHSGDLHVVVRPHDNTSTPVGEAVHIRVP